jgi:hypothetical protein
MHCAGLCRVLTNNYLSGTVPLALGSVTTLTNLVLGSNTLYGSIPDLSTLKNLINLCALHYCGDGELDTTCEYACGVAHICHAHACCGIDADCHADAPPTQPRGCCRNAHFLPHLRAQAFGEQLFRSARRRADGADVAV